MDEVSDVMGAEGVRFERESNRNECFMTNQELALVDMWEGVNLVWFVDDGEAGVQIPTGYIEIKMLFFTVVFVFAGTVLVKCQNCT
ncbi:unnamed protein product, partial [Timema podura]|nr:unnamed protein product [Timema podura]